MSAPCECKYEGDSGPVLTYYFTRKRSFCFACMHGSCDCRQEGLSGPLAVCCFKRKESVFLCMDHLTAGRMFCLALLLFVVSRGSEVSILPVCVDHVTADRENICPSLVCCFSGKESVWFVCLCRPYDRG